MLAVIRRAVADRGYGIPAHEQPDVVQQSVLEVWQALQRPHVAPPRSLDAFARAIAYRRCVDWWRRRRATDSLAPELESRGPSPEQAYARGELVERGRRLLAKLGDSCRRVLRLRMVEGLSYREIAEREGRSEGAVRNQVYKCLQRARRFEGVAAVASVSVEEGE